MPQQFFTNTIENKFIKAMLRNFPIPLIPSITDGEMMIEGCTYIYNTNIVKCTQTGKIKSKFDPVLTVNEEITVSENLVIGLGYVPAKFDIISYYIWGDEIPKITQKYISRYDYYDPETHYYLGQYLRYMRDLRGIDLMPFYNCFNCTTISDIILDKNAPNGYTLSHSDAYKTVCVPIKFNKKYTIAIDSNSRVLMKSIFYSLCVINYHYSHILLFRGGSFVAQLKHKSTDKSVA